MGLFDIFKRKPGGTFVGNLLRGTAKAVAGAINPKLGAIVGNGAMMISQEQYDLKNLSEADYIAKYGTTKTGAVVQSVVPQPQIMPIQQRIDAAAINPMEVTKQAVSSNVLETAKKYWWALAFPVVGIVIYFITRKRRR